VAGTPSKEGHGIGLSIVQRIIEMHQGTVAVNSTLHVGTVFSVELKLAYPKGLE
jgi:signal transduction histidine kinase